MLDLPAAGDEQDWELQLVDPGRLGDFTRAYGDSSLDDDDRRALMALIVASADESIEPSAPPPPEFALIASLLEKDHGLHRRLIDYWSRGEIDDPELQFSISPWMRELRRSLPELHQAPVKDGEHEHPVATAWRSTFADIVTAFIRGDFALSECVANVEPVSEETAIHMRRYVADCGETLVPLPPDTWSTSVAQWMGSYWHVLVDLWTRESGRSDMVLDARVFEAPESFRVAIHLVYVP